MKHFKTRLKIKTIRAANDNQKVITVSEITFVKINALDIERTKKLAERFGWNKHLPQEDYGDISNG